MDGHEYSYNDDTQELKNNYGTVVANWEDDISKEYYYPNILDVKLPLDPPPIHVNVIRNTAKARGQWLVQTYVAATTDAPYTY